jgi:hypothetical protein
VGSTYDTASEKEDGGEGVDGGDDHGGDGFNEEREHADESGQDAEAAGEERRCRMLWLAPSRTPAI